MWSEDKTFIEKALPDKNLLKNLSNLPFLSRILQKVVLHKLLSHLQENKQPQPQSAYRAGHVAPRPFCYGLETTFRPLCIDTEKTGPLFSMTLTPTPPPQKKELVSERVKMDFMSESRRGRLVS